MQSLWLGRRGMKMNLQLRERWWIVECDFCDWKWDMSKDWNVKETYITADGKTYCVNCWRESERYKEMMERMANNYQHRPGTDAADSRGDDETAVRPKRQGHNYPGYTGCVECDMPLMGTTSLKCYTCGEVIHEECIRAHLLRKKCVAVLLPDKEEEEYIPSLSHSNIDRSIKGIRRDVDELIRTVNQIVRLLRNWVNVYDPELMIENLQEIPTGEPPS